MNILFVYPTLFYPEHGGVERVTDLLAKEFVRRGHNVYYLHNKPDESLNDYSYPAEIYYFPEVDYKSKDNHSFYKTFLNAKRIDVVINQCGCFGDSSLYCDVEGSAARVFSCVHMNPYLSYQHLFREISVLRNNSFVEKFKRIARCLIYPKLKTDYLSRLKNHYNWINDHTHKLVLLSEKFKSEIIELNPKFDDNKIIAIPNPNTYEIFENAEKENIVLWVGRMDMQQKRPDYMIRIWKRITNRFPNWRLVMAGDGKDMPRVKMLAQTVQNIELLGYKNPQSYYKRAKIFCMTSAFEGFGMVLTEAKANGAVPIAFNSFASLSDTIKDSRQIVEPFNMQEYCDKLVALMSNERLRTELMDNGFNEVAEFRIEKIVDIWEYYFKMTLS